MRALLPLLLVPAAACSNAAVRGDIDGEKVEVVDAFMVEESGVYGDDDLVRVYLSGVSASCDAAVAFNEALDEAETLDDYADAWAENYPDDFWTVIVELRVSDLDDDLSGELFDGVDWDEFLEDDDEAYAAITHYKQHLDNDYWYGEVEDYDDYFESWFSDGGELKVKNHKPGDRIGGVFETDAAETDDGDNSGEIKIKFDAPRCTGVEKYLF